MTEKRFTYFKCEILDNGEHFAYAYSEYNAEDISNLLNELYEENQLLKYKNEILSDELEQAKAVINKKWSEYLKKKME